ncbi:MAG: hypothetical protein NC293_09705, partial [Roseburia sp.]|nr:hypothetical protein [Roseburia sp.]
MASYSKFVLTDKGRLLLNKVIAGECNLAVTRAATGDGDHGDGADLAAQTELKGLKQFFGISSCSRTGDKVCIQFVISNHDPDTGAGLTEEYRVKEIGIFAEDPAEGEILYALSTAGEGKGDFIPAYDDASPVTVTVNAYLVVGTGGNVTIRVSPDVYATAADVAALRQRTVDVEEKIDDLIWQQENFYQPRGDFTGNIDDLHKPEDTGVYWVIKASASGTMPSQEASPDYFHLIVSNSKTTTTVQTAVVWMGDKGAPYVHVRNYINKIWSPWRNLQKAESAVTAVTAESAAMDGSGNDISSTYLRKTGGYVSQYLIVAGSVTAGGLITETNVYVGSDYKCKIRREDSGTTCGIALSTGDFGFFMLECNNTLLPLVDGMNIGSSAFGKRIGSIYTKSGTLTGSDRHIKENIEPLAGNDKYLELFDRV